MGVRVKSQSELTEDGVIQATQKTKTAFGGKDQEKDEDKNRKMKTAKGG